METNQNIGDCRSLPDEEDERSICRFDYANIRRVQNGFILTDGNGMDPFARHGAYSKEWVFGSCHELAQFVKEHF